MSTLAYSSVIWLLRKLVPGGRCAWPACGRPSPRSRRLAARRSTGRAEPRRQACVSRQSVARRAVSPCRVGFKAKPGDAARAASAVHILRRALPVPAATAFSGIRAQAPWPLAERGRRWYPAARHETTVACHCAGDTPRPASIRSCALCGAGVKPPAPSALWPRLAEALNHFIQRCV